MDKDISYYYYRASHFFRKGDLTTAREEIRKHEFPISQSTFALYELLGVIERQLGNIESAISIWESIIQGGLASGGVYNNLANCYREAKNPSLAEEYYRRAILENPVYEDAAVNLAIVLRERGAYFEAGKLLDTFIKSAKCDVRTLHVKSLLCRDVGDLQAALKVLNRALMVEPNNVQLMHLKARFTSEAGAKSSELYRSALSNAPHDDEIFLGYCVSLFEEGFVNEGKEALEQRLHKKPLWLKGHAALAQLVWQFGLRDHTKSYIEALNKEPDSLELWTAYFSTLMRSGRYATVLEYMSLARNRCGDHNIFDRIEASCATEAGNLPLATRLFERLPVDRDFGISIPALRHMIRLGRMDKATEFAEYLAAQGSMSGWSYLTLLWRVMGDERVHWLENLEESIANVTISLDESSLGTVSKAVRNCHRSTRHPFDQSMRNGTQTDGNLLNRSDPAINELRSYILAQVSEYSGRLKKDLTHPFFKWARSEASLLASYSVLLRNQGFHVSHMHPHTWISCCLYLSVPESIGDSPANPYGWFSIGRPPEGLGIHLAPRLLVKPVPGNMVIFPSFLWHGTVPFSQGERMSVVCDLVVRE